jgi:hypothetical protein
MTGPWRWIRTNDLAIIGRALCWAELAKGNSGKGGAIRTHIGELQRLVLSPVKLRPIRTALVHSRGIEPRSSVLQTDAFT